MGYLTPDLEKKLTAAVDKMPAFPKSVQRILELSRDINCLPRDLVDVIEKDPVITIKILKVINSAYYRLPNKITSLKQSVVYLGVNTVKNLALSFSTIGMLPRHVDAGFDLQNYLTHSLASAALTRQLCEDYAVGEADPTDGYVAGLLHDFGKVVFAQYMPNEFNMAITLANNSGIPLHKAEEHVIGADHTVVGAMLARKWQFPEELIDCIANHHNDVADSALGECLHAADIISEKIGCDPCGAISADGQVLSLSPRFGPSLDALLENLGDINKIFEDAASNSNMDPA